MKIFDIKELKDLITPLTTANNAVVNLSEVINEYDKKYSK